MARIGLTIGEVYEIVGPRGDRAVLNDPADPDFVGYLAGDGAVTGLERAGVRESADDLPEADGGVHGAFHYTRLAFTLQGLLQGGAPPFHDAQDKLLAATDAMRQDARLLWEANGVPVMVDFRAQQPTRIGGRIPKTFLVAGVSERNVVRSQAENVVEALTGGGSVPSGFSSDLTDPLTSAPGTDGQATATHAGRAERAWPILEVYGPCTNPTLINVTDGNRGLYLIYELLAGEWLTIDTDPRRRSVRLNGGPTRYSALDFARSEWWGLVPGDNAIRVAFNTYSAGAKLRVRWRDAWG